MFINNCKKNRIRIDGISLLRNFDVLNIPKRIFPALISYSLEHLIREFNQNAQNTHNAYDDVLATVELIKHLSNYLNKKIEEQIWYIKQNQQILSDFSKNFVDLWNDANSRIKSNMKLSDFIKYFIAYLETHLNYELKLTDAKNLKKLFQHMDRYCNEDLLEKNLKKHVPEYELLREADLILGDEKVIVSTIHRAKGLEFINMIIPERNYRNFPDSKSNTKEKIEEDARLLYVAMTRAKKILIISGNKNFLSPFLKAIEYRFEIDEINEPNSN